MTELERNGDDRGGWLDVPADGGGCNGRIEEGGEASSRTKRQTETWERRRMGGCRRSRARETRRRETTSMVMKSPGSKHDSGRHPVSEEAEPKPQGS